MGHRLTTKPVPGDWNGICNAIAKLDNALNSSASPEFVGTTISGLTANALMYADSSGVLTSFAAATNGQLIIGSTGAVPSVATLTGTANEIDITNAAGSITIGIVNPLIVAKGGIGIATLTDHGILLGSGTGAITPLGVASNGQIPIGSAGADPVLATITGTADEIDITNAAGSITIGLINPLIVGKGGIGAATLTDGGVLLGSGTDPITAMAVLGNGEFIVGNGTTDPVAESGATVRTSLGLGTGDSPQFTGGIFTGLTASEIVGTTADKALVSIPVIGNGLTLHGGDLYWAWLGMSELSESPAEDSMMVWNGPGNAVLWEDGATLRTTLGLGTDASPTFAGLTVDNTGGTDAVITMDGSSNSAGTITYESDNNLFSINKKVGICITDPSTDLEVLNDIMANSYKFKPINTATIAADSGNGIKLTSDLFEVAGRMIADTDTLVVDVVNHRMGIGTASPENLLHLKNDNYQQILFDRTENENVDTKFYLGPSYAASTSQLRISSDSLNTIMAIGEDGKIGIGGNGLRGMLEIWVGNTYSTGLTLYRGVGTTFRMWLDASDNYHLNRGTDTRWTMDSSGKIGFSEPAPETLLEMTSAIPYLTLHNNTEEDGDGGRESRINFKGEQSGTEETTLARIEVSHDGIDDDEKGKMVFSVNDGSDSDTPTAAIKISADGSTAIGDGGTTNYTQISATGDISFIGSAGFYPRFLTQADEPAAGTGAAQCDTSELVVWKDSDDNTVYLCFNDGGTIKTVELV